MRRLEKIIMLRDQKVLVSTPCCSISRLPKYTIEDELQLNPKVVIRFTTNNATEKIPNSSTDSLRTIMILEIKPNAIELIRRNANEKNRFLLRKILISLFNI